MAKNLKAVANDTSNIYSDIIGTTEPKKKAQKVQATQEVQEVSEEMNTQGKKGEKLPRINMAFSPANHEFITTMARLGGLTLTQYVNRLVDAEREANKDVIEQAKQVLAYMDKK